MRAQRPCKIEIYREGDYFAVFENGERVGEYKLSNMSKFTIIVDSVIYEEETYTKDSFSVRSLAELKSVDVEDS